MSDSITCPICKRTSYHPGDIEHQWCANCNMYIGEVIALVEKVTAEALAAGDPRPVRVFVCQGCATVVVTQDTEDEINRELLASGQVPSGPDDDLVQVCDRCYESAMNL